MTTTINAVADKEFSIEAAVEKLPPNIRRLMASANLNLGGKKISTAEIDRQLEASSLNNE